MANTKALNVLLDVLVVVVGFVLHVFKELIVFEVNVSHSRRVLKFLWGRFSVANRAAREAFELHNILGQRAGLV